MKDTTYEKLFELSYKTKEKLVTPLILDYYRFESLGINETGIVNLIRNKCNPILS
ncbi:MAG: hypothetical protein NTU63_01110 [Candidatus Pacearchaeota archaeon]|nr:hypothetical protein [Candidatus Pacearchaeota archaeon]